LVIIFVSSGEWFGAVHLDEATAKIDPARETMKETDMNAKLTALALAGLMSAATYAAEPDTQVVEYYHGALKHYIITGSAVETRLVDSGIAGPWVRTGRVFGAWSKRETAPADAVAVHRFYSYGANSHGLTANEDEVRLLKQLEADERAAIAGTGKTFLGWGYEREAFLALLPKNGVCPAGTEAITRHYNQGFVTGEGSNHRYVSDDSLRGSMDDRKWVAEGVGFCAPLSSSAADASSSSNTSSAITAGEYSGSVQFKLEVLGNPQVKFSVPLVLNLAADGSLSGTGGGCKFAGTSAAKSGGDSRLRGGSVTAVQCNDARFNGTYGRVEIEQFGAKAIDVRFKQGDNARELQIEGVLTGTASGVTPTPNPTPTSPDAIAGDFAGVASWLITQRASGQQEVVVFDVNRQLALKVSATGAVTGSGQGCSFTGAVSPGLNNRFTGTVTATGCTEARLNGGYQAAIHPEDGGAIEAELEREVEQGGTRTKASIKGDLSRSAGGTTTPPPPPPPSSSGVAIAGNFSGDATWLATRRPAGGRETTEVSKTQTLQLAVSSTGAVTGSGAGCTFSGSLALSNATLGIFAGTITASGCTDGIVRGSYSATATRENGNGLEIELERETETNGERVKVKIKGRLAKL
jgi:heat shock protein HslJ